MTDRAPVSNVIVAICRALVDLKGQLSSPSHPRSIRRSQRRLKPTEIDQLLAAYTTGELVNDTAARFGLSRTTVIGHVTRQGLPRRHDRCQSLRGWPDSTI